MNCLIIEYERGSYMDSITLLNSRLNDALAEIDSLTKQLEAAKMIEAENVSYIQYLQNYIIKLHGSVVKPSSHKKRVVKVVKLK